MPEECLRHTHARIRAVRQQSRVPETRQMIVPQHLGPFGALEGNAVRAGEARRNEADALIHSVPVLADGLQLTQNHGNL